MSKYKIQVKTGNINSAGTDAAVFIQLIGAIRTSEPCMIDNAEDNFERDKLDTFDLDIDSVGWINEIRIYHDDSGSASGWFLDYVEVTDLSYGLCFRADFYRWLARDEDDLSIDVTRKIPIRAVELKQGSITSEFIGYDSRQRKTQSLAVFDKETFSYSYKAGTSLKTATGKTTTTGIKVGASFFGLVSSEFTLSVSSAVSKELNSFEERVIESTSEVEFTLQPHKAVTIVILYYQDVLTGEAQADGMSMEFEQRFVMVTDHVFLDGWLSKVEVQEYVDSLMLQKIAKSGSGSALPSTIPRTEAAIPLAVRPIAGPLDLQHVEATIKELHNQLILEH